MMFSVVAFVPAFAEDQEVSDHVLLATDGVAGPAGTEARFTVSVANVPECGLSSVRFNVKVEGAVITAVTPDVGLPESGYSVVGPLDKAATDGVNFMWVDITTGITGDAALASFTVAIPADAVCGAEYTITVSISDDPQDFTALDGTTDVPAAGSFGVVQVDHTLNHVEAKEATKDEDGNIEYWVCESCGKYFSDAEATAEIDAESVVVVYVSPFKPADVNGDGKLNSRDVVLVMKAAIPGFTTPETGYVFEAADMNGDGKINSRDVVAVMKEILNQA